jgi:hypothetical protein
MRKLCGVVITGLALAALPVVSSAQGTTTKTTAPATQKAAEPKLLDAMGSVSAVTTDSLTVKSKTETWTFTIDAKTEVIAKGATHKTLAIKADGKSPVLTDFVKVSDLVTVKYHDMGATKHAATIRVTTPTK